MTEIPFANAFTLNRFGVNAAPFPLSVEYSRQGEVSCLLVCPQRVVDICDLLETYAGKTIAVFDVAHTSAMDARTMKPLTLVELASKAKIEFSPIDASTIVLSISSLSRLLSAFDHFEFHLFDTDQNWDEVQVISQVITCREHDWCSGAHVLAALSHSRLFLYCHDDCYLTLESRDSVLLKRVFARTLHIYAGTVLEEEGRTSSNVAEITDNVIDEFWHDALGLTILREMTTCDDSRLRIGVSKHPFNFRERGEYPTELSIEYDVTNQTWAVGD